MSSRQNGHLRIAVDLDGVLAETMEAWCRHANEFLGTSFKLADLDTWASWRKLGITKEQFFQFLDEAWDDWKGIPPTEPRLAENVRKLARLGQIDIVTGRSKDSVHSAKSWLAEHKIPYQRFVRVLGWKDKIFLNYDVYIDDAPELMPLVSRNPSMWGILYTRPWNREVPDIPRIFRVQNWTEIPRLVEKNQQTVGSGSLGPKIARHRKSAIPRYLRVSQTSTRFTRLR